MSFAKLENFIFEKVSASKLPGVAAALVKDDQIIWSCGFGYRSLENSTPATPSSLYCIGSVSKSFTSLAVLQLAEQGKLSLTDPVDKYLDFDLKPFGEKILIWHFLSHTSGIPALAYAEAVIHAAMGEEEYWIPAASANDLLTFMQDAGDWAESKPGERWFYLNEGYELLGAIIEKVSGLKYEDYVEKHILGPLGMKNSSFKKEVVEKNPDFATPYIVTADGKRLPTTYPYGSVSAAGGLISSPEDMAKVISMYLNWGKTPSGQLLSRESLQDMQTPRIPTPHLENPFGSYDYALGLGVLPDFLGNKLVGHSGSVGSATAYMGFIPEKKLGVVVLTNGSGYSTSFMGQYALALALGEDPEKLPFVQKENLLKKLSGNYETYKGTTKVQVRPAGDFLMVVSKGKYGSSTVPLIPLELTKDKQVFYTLSGGNKVLAEFKMEEGKTTFIYERYAYRKTGELV